MTAEVAEADLGNRALRYLIGPLLFLPVVSRFLPGAGKLRVNATLVKGGGAPRYFEARAIGVGRFLGGSDKGVMASNVRKVSSKLADSIARALTGRSMLSADAYRYAELALALGIGGCVPVLGFLTLLPVSILGIGAYCVLVKRGIRKRRFMAIGAVLLNIIGIIGGMLLIRLSR